MDYSKWERLGNAAEEEEAAVRAARSAANKAKHDAELDERKRRWEAEHPGEDPHEHSGGCGCGYADPEALRRAAERRRKLAASGGELTLEERNVKKVVAARATREHGKQLFGRGEVEHALAVYERGLLIINGSYGMTEEQEREMAALEVVHHLNVAACQLRLGENVKAEAAARTAISLDPGSVKAHFRLASALAAMGRADEALAALAEADRAAPGNAAVAQLAERLRREEREKRQKARQTDRKFAERLRKAAAETSTALPT